jgi:4-carboxymuconolactone decarboxylase
MAPLPDPTDRLTGDDRAAFDHVVAARGHVAQVYLRMFNNPAVAQAVGDLGEHLRFHGTLPGHVREVVILRLAERMRLPYEWAHHTGPARAAGVDEATIAALERGTVPDGLDPQQQAALVAADAVFDLRSVPAVAQAALGDAAAVEVAALVGCYRLVGGVIAGFDVELEPELTPPRW